ncbi:hypothetical protein LMG19089_01444 [Ralstonia edaphis]|nr:hypothetical protein LMG19089_01444 [Ralstonia sp. LMG 6871]
MSCRVGAKRLARRPFSESPTVEIGVGPGGCRLHHNLSRTPPTTAVQHGRAMPHLTLEYSANLNTFDAKATLLAVNTALAATGHFVETDIKSRSHRCDTFAVGTSSAPRAFVHADLAILSGRPLETRRELSASVLAVLQAQCSAPAGVHLQLSVQVLEIERESYAKVSIEAHG